MCENRVSTRHQKQWQGFTKHVAVLHKYLSSSFSTTNQLTLNFYYFRKNAPSTKSRLHEHMPFFATHLNFWECASQLYSDEYIALLLCVCREYLLPLPAVPICEQRRRSPLLRTNVFQGCPIKLSFEFEGCCCSVRGACTHALSKSDLCCVKK